MSKFINIKEAAKRLGVSTSTLRRWDEIGVLVAERPPRGHQGYDVNKLSPDFYPVPKTNKKTIVYAHVSSHDPKDDLTRQIQVLELYCANQGWQFEMISDLGSGINYHKKGLKSLLDGILNDEIERLVLTHKGRLSRFGAELIFMLCEAKDVEIVIINQLAQDALEIITVFSVRLYGAHSSKNKKLLKAVKEVLQ